MSARYRWCNRKVARVSDPRMTFGPQPGRRQMSVSCYDGRAGFEVVFGSEWMLRRWSGTAHH